MYILCLIKKGADIRHHNIQMFQHVLDIYRYRDLMKFYHLLNNNYLSKLLALHLDKMKKYGWVTELQLLIIICFATVIVSSHLDSVVLGIND